MSPLAGSLPLAARLPLLLARWRRLSCDHRLLPRAYILCLCSMFLCTGNTVPQSIYYVIVLPLTALSALGFARRTLGSSTIFWGVALYLAAIGLSSLLQPAVDLTAVGGYLRRTAMVLTFVVATAYLTARSRRFLPTALVALSVTAALSALANMAALLHGRSLDHGLGELRLVATIGMPGYGNSTNIALTYAVLLVGATAALPSGGLSRLQRRLLLAAAGVLLLALLMTQSRGPLAAALLGIVALGLAQARWRLALAALAAIAAGCIALAAVPALHEAFLARGDSFRFALWRHYLDLAAARPLRGYGLYTNTHFRLPDGPLILHPHNLLLSAEIRGGALASLTLLAWLAAAFYWGGRYWLAQRRAISIALLLTVVLAGTVDYEIFSTSPDWMWVTYWLPVGACLGAEMALRRAQSRRRAAMKAAM